MCGWVSIWRPGRRLPERRRLEHARDLMRSRGPDDAGLWAEGDIALGHRRLSILDLSPSGHQPMERHGIVVAFNGEIYNHRELRRQLESAGERFIGHSDTEVLPLGLRVWGFEELLRRIDGMFSFCLWDKHQRTMYVARDRVGKKPLYYGFADGGMVAASDLKAVTSLIDSRLEVEPGVLPLYLYHGFIPAPYTVYRRISKLRPATAAVIREKDGELVKTEFPYWRLSYRPDKRISTVDAEQVLDGLLRNAVERRLIADVPVGAFLSGGVDSSAVVSYAAELHPGIETFSIGFTHQSHNELPHARLVAQACGTRHHEEILQVDVLGDLPQIARNHGEPFADSSAVPSHAVARAARRHVTVVLTGDGGDEVFAGYPTARAAWLAGFYKQLVGLPTRERIERVATLLCSGRRLPGPVNSLWSLLRYGSRPLGMPYLDGDLWRDDLRAGLLADEARRRTVVSPRGWHGLLGEAYDAPDELTASLGLDMLVRLPNDYLTKVDVATMATGLEARSPFLDTALIEFACRLPRSVLMPGGESKGLLKKLTASRVPREVVYRPKAGFALPLGAWMRGSYRRPIESMLLSKRFFDRGWFEPEVVRRTVAEHMAGRFDHSARLWSLIAWESWCRNFLDGEGYGEQADACKEAA